MKGKFDPYVLWPLAQKFQNWIVDRSTARDFTVLMILWWFFLKCLEFNLLPFLFHKLQFYVQLRCKYPHKNSFQGCIWMARFLGNLLHWWSVHYTCRDDTCYFRWEWCLTPDNYSTTDHWIQESIKRIFNSRLFWAVGAAKKNNPNCHKVCYFWCQFFNVFMAKNIF